MQGGGWLQRRYQIMDFVCTHNNNIYDKNFFHNSNNNKVNYRNNLKCAGYLYDEVICCLFCLMKSFGAQR